MESLELVQRSASCKFISYLLPFLQSPYQIPSSFSNMIPIFLPWWIPHCIQKEPLLHSQRFERISISVSLTCCLHCCDALSPFSSRPSCKASSDATSSTIFPTELYFIPQVYVYIFITHLWKTCAVLCLVTREVEMNEQNLCQVLTKLRDLDIQKCNTIGYKI